jgi:hypothetical protein
MKKGLILRFNEIEGGIVLEDLNGIYGKLFMSDRILDDELSQIRELLFEIASAGSRTFTLWVQGFQSSEMSNRERVLNNLSTAGLVSLDWKFTHHNAYIKAKITEKGSILLQKVIGALPKSPVA